MSPDLAALLILAVVILAFLAYLVLLSRVAMDAIDGPFRPGEAEGCDGSQPEASLSPSAASRRGAEGPARPEAPLPPAGGPR